MPEDEENAEYGVIDWFYDDIIESASVFGSEFMHGFVAGPGILTGLIEMGPSLNDLPDEPYTIAGKAAQKSEDLDKYAIGLTMGLFTPAIATTLTLQPEPLIFYGLNATDVVNVYDRHRITGKIGSWQKLDKLAYDKLGRAE